MLQNTDVCNLVPHLLTSTSKNGMQLFSSSLVNLMVACWAFGCLWERLSAVSPWGQMTCHQHTSPTFLVGVWKVPVLFSPGLP